MKRGQTPEEPSARVFCRWPGCEHKFKRKQELERHTLTHHLPPLICCPHPSCSWRGTLKHELKKHMDKRCGKKAKMDPRLYKVFDAKWIFDYMYEDSTDAPTDFNAEVMLTYVLDFVKERGIELRKTKLWGDPWGRKSKGQRR